MKPGIRHPISNPVTDLSPTKFIEQDQRKFPCDVQQCPLAGITRLCYGFFAFWRSFPENSRDMQAS
jgi:hypothetical protein